MTVVVTHTTPADSTFSSTGAAAWNADHALSGVGTMAEQNANNVAITGGTINNTTIGATTPSTGVFTTLTGNSTSQFGRSSTNYVQIVGAATTVAPNISAQGGDTNIPLRLSSKNDATIYGVTNGVISFDTYAPSGSVNYLRLRGNATGTGAALESFGSDSNVDIILSTKGTGALRTYTNGNQQLAVTNTASAVNYVQVTGSATGNNPSITVQGSDASRSLNIGAKGTTFVILSNNGTVPHFSAGGTGSAVNYLNARGNATGTGPALEAVGSDTNIGLVLQPKGTGALQAQQTDSTATGGNARGANAVDWQTSRSAASQVASGSGGSVIAGGVNNTASAFGAAVLGGGTNSSSGNYTPIVGGLSNTSTGQFGFIGGGSTNTLGGNQYPVVVGGYGNTAGGWFNFIGNGFTNSGTSASVVTTQTTTTVTSGSTAITLSASNASIKVGQQLTGTGIVFPSYVSAISGTSLTLSQAASASGTPTLSFYTPHGVVVGGGNNQATGAYSAILGGGDAGTAANRNVASGDWSFVGGGTKNIASGLYSSVNGSSNTASGTASVVAGGGAFGAQGFLGNQASGTGSFIGAGIGNLANSSHSAIVSGTLGTTRGIDANHVFPAINNAFGANATGVAQSALLVLAKQTTDATATVLVSNNSAVGTTNQVILPNNSAYTFRGEIVSGVTGGGNSKSWTIEGLIKRGANAASTTLVGSTVTSLYADAGATTWAIALSADTTNGGLAVTFTGQAATTIRTVCQIRTTEMTY